MGYEIAATAKILSSFCLRYILKEEQKIGNVAKSI